MNLDRLHDTIARGGNHAVARPFSTATRRRSFLGRTPWNVASRHRARLGKVLPEPYFAAPTVHLGTLREVDQENVGEWTTTPVATPEPKSALDPRLPHQDVYEVRIYDNRRNR